MYKKILVAVDGSETSKLALAEAVRLAKAFQSTVRAVYIVDSPAMLFDVGYYDPTELRKSFIEAGTALLADTAATRAELVIVAQRSPKRSACTVFSPCASSGEAAMTHVVRLEPPKAPRSFHPCVELNSSIRTSGVWETGNAAI